jgi:DNA-directed RNA polymerase beta subunit
MLRKKEAWVKRKSYFGVLSTICLWYFRSPYVRNYKRIFFNKNVNWEELVNEIWIRDWNLIYLRTIHSCYHEMYRLLRIIWLAWNLERVYSDDEDMNHLKNKRIRSVADLLQDQFGLALGRLQHAVQKTIGGVYNEIKLFTIVVSHSF